MENATLTISLPRAMKNFIGERLREASFSTPSEYIRSLIRFDQERRSREAFARQEPGKALPVPDDEAGTAAQNVVFQRRVARRTNDRTATKRKVSKE